MDIKTLLKFIAKAHKNTYAASKEIKNQYRCETPILDQHKDYEYTEVIGNTMILILIIRGHLDVKWFSLKVLTYGLCHIKVRRFLDFLINL
ncbi:MAG: hypothetical protein K0B02_04040 [DPANN group archaeon]|nr:hypothetical protein [DPANN group archaeon]